MTRLLFLFLFPAFAQEGADSISVSDFRGGLNTVDSSALIGENETPSAQNVLFDESMGVTTREGSSKLNGTSIGNGGTDVNGVFELRQSDGDKYCLAFSSTTGYYSTDGCQTFTAFVSTLTANNDVSCDFHADKAYCVNNQYNFYFDGTNDVVMSGIPATMDFIRVHRNRCFSAGDDSAPGRLYWSALGNCNSWTTSTDWVDVCQQQGQVITGIGEPIFDMLPIYCDYSTWAIKGKSAASFELVNISKNTGAKNHRSISNWKNLQLFDSLGPYGGEPGIYAFNGVVVEPISGKLRKDMRNLDTFNASVGRKALDSKGDFDLGTFDAYAMSTSREPGILQSSYTTFTDTSESDFGTFTSSASISTSVVSGSVTLYPSTMTVPGASDYTGWSIIGGSIGNATCSSGFNTAPSKAVTFTDSTFPCSNSQNNSSFDILSPTNDLLLTLFSSVNGPVSCYSSYNHSLESIPTAQQNVKFKFLLNSGKSATSSLGVRGSFAHIQLNKVDSGGSCITTFNIEVSTSYMASGSFTSRTFDMAISTPTWGLFQATVSSGAGVGNITFQVQAASDSGGTFESLVSQSLGSEIGAAQKRYLRYKASFTSSASTQTPRLDDVTISAASTGTWTSAETFLSNNITTWGLFQSVQTTAGSEASIAYCLRTSTTSGQTNGKPCTALTSGSAITASTGAYVVIVATFTIGVATETAQVDSFILNWNEGSAAKSSSGKTFRGRYHYGAQSQDGTENDTIYVLDRNGAWTKFAGIYPRMLNVVDGNFVMATSSTGATAGGFLYKLYDTNADNGRAINAFWESKDFTLGKLQNLKSVDRVFLLHASSNTTLSGILKADIGSTSTNFTANLSSSKAFDIHQEVFPSPINGNTFRIRFGNNAASQPWQVLGVGLSFQDLGLAPP